MLSIISWSAFRGPLIVVAALLLIVGCSSGPRRASAVDPEAARSALRTALERWKAGDAPDTLKEASPAIVVQDLDWELGAELIDFEVTGEGTLDNANLRVPVALRLRSPEGAEVQKDVVYVVGTDPVITVFRELF